MVLSQKISEVKLFGIGHVPHMYTEMSHTHTHHYRKYACVCQSLNAELISNLQNLHY